MIELLLLIASLSGAMIPSVVYFADIFLRDKKVFLEGGDRWKPIGEKSMSCCPHPYNVCLLE